MAQNANVGALKLLGTDPHNPIWITSGLPTIREFAGSVNTKVLFMRYVI
jgi:hypothetical protein